MKPRFTTRSMLVFMSSIACGFAMARLRGHWLEDFFRGMLTAYVGIGLVEQIIATGLSPQSRILNLARNAILTLILLSIVASIVHIYLPYQVSTRSSDEVATIKSLLAPSLLDVTLILGLLTTPWMSFSTDAGHAPVPGRMRIALNASAFVMYSAGLIVLTPFSVMILAFVDISIFGIHLGRQQWGTTGTPNFVREVTRSDALFGQFVTFTLWSWPLLIIAFSIATWRSQIDTASRKVTVVWLVAVLLLSLPSLANLSWLLAGGAHRLFPELYESMNSLVVPDWHLALLLCFMIAVYSATRYTDRVCMDTESDSIIPETDFSSDSGLAGLAMLVLGAIETYDALRFAMRMSDSLSEIGMNAMEFVIYEPRIFLNVLQILFAVNWLWHRTFRNDIPCERWPQPQMRHTFWCPLIFGIFVTLVLLAAPFGISFWNAGLR